MLEVAAVRCIACAAGSDASAIAVRDMALVFSPWARVSEPEYEEGAHYQNQMTASESALISFSFSEFIRVGILPELGVIAPSPKPGGACAEGYPALHCTLMSPNSPARVTFASHFPVSTLETCRAREAKPTCTT